MPSPSSFLTIPYASKTLCEESPISHFRVPKTLTFKTRQSAKLSYKNEFYLHENKKNHFRITSFALSLDLKQRLGVTRKWPNSDVYMTSSQN